MLLGAVGALAASSPCPGRYVVREERRADAHGDKAWLADAWCAARCDTPAGCRFEVAGKVISRILLMLYRILV